MVNTIGSAGQTGHFGWGNWMACVILCRLVGVAILLITEIGMLMATSRTSTNGLRTVPGLSTRLWFRQVGCDGLSCAWTILIFSGLLVIPGEGLEQLRFASAWMAG